MASLTSDHFPHAPGNPLNEPFYMLPDQYEISYASPAFSVAGKMLRFKRTNRSSSGVPLEACDGFMEDDLQAGGPHLCQLPCEIYYQITKSHRDFDKYFHPVHGQLSEDVLQSLIKRIAERYDLQVEEIRFCGRRSVFNSDSDMELTMTAIIEAKRQNPTDRGWVKIARKVVKYLDRKGLQDVAVEIIDPGIYGRQKVFSTLTTDPIFPMWKDVGKKIMDSLVDLEGILTIGCHRMGYSENREECPVTIVLGVDRRVNCCWEAVRESVLQVLDGFKILGGVVVLIRKEILVKAARKLSRPSTQSKIARERSASDAV